MPHCTAPRSQAPSRRRRQPAAHPVAAGGSVPPPPPPALRSPPAPPRRGCASTGCAAAPRAAGRPRGPRCCHSAPPPAPPLAAARSECCGHRGRLVGERLSMAGTALSRSQPHIIPHNPAPLSKPLPVGEEVLALLLRGLGQLRDEQGAGTHPHALRCAPKRRMQRELRGLGGVPGLATPGATSARIPPALKHTHAAPRPASCPAPQSLPESRPRSAPADAAGTG